MNVIHKVVDFIEDKDIKLTFSVNKLYIVNYKEIVRFNEKLVIIKHEQGLINIIGENLMIARLLATEMLIIGSIKKIEIEG